MLKGGEMLLFDDLVRPYPLRSAFLLHDFSNSCTGARSVTRRWMRAQYPTEPRGVKSLAGLKEITYMNREECDIPNSFKVRHRTSPAPRPSVPGGAR